MYVLDSVPTYSHPNLAPNAQDDRGDDNYYYPPTPPASTSPKPVVSTPPPLVAPAPSWRSVFFDMISSMKPAPSQRLAWHPFPEIVGVIDQQKQSMISIAQCKTRCKAWFKDVMSWKHPLQSWLLMAACMTVAATLSNSSSSSAEQNKHELVMYHWMRMTGLVVWTMAVCQIITRRYSPPPRGRLLLDALWIDKEARSQINAMLLTHDPRHEMVMAGVVHYMSIESPWVIAILFGFIATLIMSAHV